MPNGRTEVASRRYRAAAIASCRGLYRRRYRTSDAPVVPVPQTMRLDEPSVPPVASPRPRMRFWAGVVLVAALGLAAGGYAWFRITTTAVR